MKHIIEEHLDTIVEGAGAVGIIVIFTAHSLLLISYQVFVKTQYAQT